MAKDVKGMNVVVYPGKGEKNIFGGVDGAYATEGGEKCYRLKISGDKSVLIEEAKGGEKTLYINNREEVDSEIFNLEEYSMRIKGSGEEILLQRGELRKEPPWNRYMKIGDEVYTGRLVDGIGILPR